MFPNPLSTYEVNRMEQQALVASATERSRLVSADVAERPTRRVTGFAGRVFAAALASVASLAHESRPQLRSKEQELAALGVTWRTDSALDTVLVRQIATARDRRGAALAVKDAAAPRPPRPAEPAPAPA